MGRKLIRRAPTEKSPGLKSGLGHVTIVISQHLLLGCSGYVIASNAYLIHTGAITKDLLPVVVVLLFAGCASIIYIILCNATSWRWTKPSGRSFLMSPACLQTLSKNALRVVVTAWMVASGLVITFTAARQPFCLVSARAILHSPAIDVGTQCMVQRASVAASLLAMLISITLFILVLKTPNPYLAHLLGINKPPTLLPFTLPYKTADHRPMFSEMSFKCRSTSSFSSYTLADPSQDSLYALYPTRPEKAYGLGIYAPKTTTTASSTASFLTPRPSLKTIRSQASLGHRQLQQSSPLPPLPVYDPEKYKKMPAAQKALCPPPRRAYTLKRKGGQGGLRVVPRSPAGLVNKPLMRNLSTSGDSLSSVYSRSVSGGDPVPAVCEDSVRTAGSATVRRSPLAAMRLAPQPEMRMRAVSGHRMVKSDDTGDARPGVTARLPLTRAVSTFGSAGLGRAERR